MELGGTALLAAVTADVSATTIAQAFAGGEHVYVASDVDTGSLRFDLAQVRQAASGHDDVHVAVVPQSFVADMGSYGKAAAAIGNAADQSESYVVATPNGLGVYRPDGQGALVAASALGQGSFTDGLVYAVEHASVTASAGETGTSTETRPVPNGDSGGGGIGAGGTLITLAVLAAIVALIVRRSRRNREDRVAIGSSRADVQSEIDTLGDDLRITDPGGNPEIVGSEPNADPAQRALQVAWSRHAAAAGALASARGPHDVERARVLAEQGRSALEHAHRLRDGVPGESEVYQRAAASGGPDPRQRMDEAPSGARGGRQQVLRQYTPDSYPGYGYGYYPGYGYGFFDYGGSFVTGMLGGALLGGMLAGPGLFGGWGGGGYGYGYDQGYEQGYDQGYDQGGDFGGGDFGGGDW